MIGRRAPRFTLGLVAALMTGGIAYASAAPAVSAGTEILGPGHVVVEMEITHSRFSPERLHVRPGTLVEFVVVNNDPIHHELIVGPPEVHAEHASGDHLEHPPVPGEVSVGPNATGTTVYRFDEPGTVVFACHLPGHVAYGMVGTVDVVP